MWFKVNNGLSHRFVGRAFTLVEIMVYLSLVCILTFIVVRIEDQLRGYSCLSHQLIHKSIREKLLFDIMWRDVIQASSNLEEWDGKNFVFKKSNVDVGWAVVKNCMLRYEGEYDFDKAEWIRKTSSVVLQDAPGCLCKLDKTKTRVRGVFISGGYVRIRNGLYTS